MRPKTDGVLETCLYVDDVARSVRFYEQTMGFRALVDLDGRGCAMEAGPRQLLLLFKKGASRGIQSPHDADGQMHVAFAVPAPDLPAWEEWLGERGIAIEERRTWPRGGQSVYFRDPDAHLLELATPGLWPNY